jgi:protein-L-isoaspartate(D-aspartate) O-methyltransferase
MDRDTEQEIIRRAYQRQIMAAFGLSDRHIEAAFASVKREDFLSRGPWQVVRLGTYRPRAEIPCTSTTTSWSASSPSATSNNGQPSLTAWLMANAAPKAGEHVVHVGAGVGYYPVILH